MRQVATVYKRSFRLYCLFNGPLLSDQCKGKHLEKDHNLTKGVEIWILDYDSETKQQNFKWASERHAHCFL